jgi:oxalate decarboxylase/phosphoglucose isomerase-like protein (cupin superfamily)
LHNLQLERDIAISNAIAQYNGRHGKNAQIIGDLKNLILVIINKYKNRIDNKGLKTLYYYVVVKALETSDLDTLQKAALEAINIRQRQLKLEPRLVNSCI